MKKETRVSNTQGSIFSGFSKMVTDYVGSAWSFTIAFSLVVIWLITGPLFHFSNTWQLIINTGTTIVTFLMVFLIQHTQNRDNAILNLKLDELIKAHKEASNTAIDLSHLSNEELLFLEKKYKKLGKKKTGI